MGTNVWVHLEDLPCLERFYLNEAIFSSFFGFRNTRITQAHTVCSLLGVPSVHLSQVSLKIPLHGLLGAASVPPCIVLCPLQHSW